eukprot:tig00020849_g14628.t1
MCASWSHLQTAAGELLRTGNISGSSSSGRLRRVAELRRAAAQRLLQGQGDGGVLTVHGAKQAELLATRLASHTINHIYVSDLDRCKDTAAPICRAHRHVVPIYERRIREQHYGVQEGKPWASSLAAEGAQEAAAAAGSNSSTGTSKRALRPEGGESLEDVKRRAIEFFHDELVPRFLAPEAPAPAPAPAADAAAPPLAPTVLLVTHGTFLREFVNWLLHRGGALDAGAPPVLPGVRNSALFELEVASAGPVPSTAPAEDPDPEPPGKRARASAEPAPPLPLKHAPRPAGRLLMPLRVSLVRANCVEHLAGVQRAPFSEQPSRSRERAAFERFFAPRSSRSEPTSAPVPLQGPSGPSGPASNPAPPTSAPALVPPSDAGPGAGSSLSRAAGNFGPGPPVPPRAPPPPPDVIVLD